MGLHVFDKLGVRVVAMLSIALLPIGLISLYFVCLLAYAAEIKARFGYDRNFCKTSFLGLLCRAKIYSNRCDKQKC